MTLIDRQPLSRDALLMSTEKDDPAAVSIPYGVALAFGTTLAFFLEEVQLQ